MPALSRVNDTLVEPSETIVLGSITGSAVTVGDANNNSSTQSSTTYTILDDDTLTVELNQASGSALDTLALHDALPILTGQVQAGHSVTIDVAVTGGTASAADYTAP